MIDANVIDPNELFFDTAGGGFENGNYVFRNNVNSANQPPTTLNVATNLIDVGPQQLQLRRSQLPRRQGPVHDAETTPSDQPGAEPVYISNLAGSPILQAVYGSYACARRNTDPTQHGCNGIRGPARIRSADGQAALHPLQGAFGASRS